MKSTIIAITLGLATLTAHAADPVAYLANEGGGRIEFFVSSAADVDPANCRDRMMVRSWTTRGANQYGCWRADSDTTTVFWFSNQTYRTYPNNAITITPTGQALLRKTNSERAL